MLNFLGGLVTKFLPERYQKYYDAYTKGHAVYDAVKTKNRQNFVNALGVLLCFGAGVWRTYYGHSFPLSDADLIQLAGSAGVAFGVYNVKATTTSTDKIGLPPRTGGNAPIEDHSFNAPVPEIPELPAQADVQPEHNSTARFAGEHDDSDNPLAGLDTTYRG
jgi:hypothetical protein